MRALLITLFLAVLSTSFAIKISTEQQALNGDSLKFGNTMLGDALTSLIQITEVDEYAECHGVLQKVRAELAALLKDTQDNYAAASTAYQTQKDVYEGALATLTSRQTEVSGLLSDAQKEKSNLEGRIDGSLAAIKEAQDNIDSENARRKAAHDAYVQKSTDLSAAIDACNQAIELLHQVDAKDLNAALIQVTTKSLRGQFEEIHSRLSNMQLKSSVLPLVKMLVEVASQGINAEMIEKLIHLIEDLRDSLSTELTNAGLADDADASYHTTAIATYESTITSETQSANENNDLLTTVKANIDAYTSELTSLGGLIAENQSNLDSLNADWATKSAAFNDSLDRIRGDIAAIDSACAYLRSHMDQDAS